METKESLLIKEAIERGFTGDSLKIKSVYNLNWEIKGNIELRYNEDWNELELWADSWRCLNDAEPMWDNTRGFSAIFNERVWATVIN